MFSFTLLATLFVASQAQKLPIACTADAKECPDGSFVGRDGNNNCEFAPCPTTTAAPGCVAKTATDCICATIYAPVYCDDGNTYSNQCAADCACATGCNQVCGTIVGLSCPDTTYKCVDIPGDSCIYGTDSDCAGQCIGLMACTKEAKQCPDGSFVGRDGYNNCEFAPCPTTTAGPVACTRDAQQCPDGSYVSRDPDNNCEFAPCPTTTAVPTDICALAMDIGPCDASIPQWFYNSVSGTCESFNYGGCEGNANRFDSKTDCLASCCDGPQFCTLQYDPVCCDGVTYGNACGAKSKCAINCVPGACSTEPATTEATTTANS